MTLRQGAGVGRACCAVDFRRQARREGAEALVRAGAERAVGKSRPSRSKVAAARRKAAPAAHPPTAMTAGRRIRRRRRPRRYYRPGAPRPPPASRSAASKRGVATCRRPPPSGRRRLLSGDDPSPRTTAMRRPEPDERSARALQAVVEFAAGRRGVGGSSAYCRTTSRSRSPRRVARPAPRGEMPRTHYLDHEMTRSTGAFRRQVKQAGRLCNANALARSRAWIAAPPSSADDSARQRPLPVRSVNPAGQVAPCRMEATLQAHRWPTRPAPVSPSPR